MKQVVTLLLAVFAAAQFTFPVANGTTSINASEDWRFASIFPEYTAKVQSGQCPYLPEPVDLPDPVPDILQKAFDNITDFLTGFVNDISVPSVVGSISYNGKGIYEIAKGKIRKAAASGAASYADSTPKMNTIYGIGSVTKVFPVLQMYMLLQKGVISSLDDPLSKYSPKFKMPNFFSNGQPTLRQIASQLAGLPREAPCDAPLVCNISNEDMIDRLTSVPLIRKPNTYPSYSNLGYALLGRELTAYAAPNLTFEEWVQGNILDPLGMKNTGFLYTDNITSSMATGYAANGNAYPSGRVQNLTGWAAPCGSAYSTVEDLNILSNAIMHSDMFELAREDFLLSPNFLNRDGQTLFGTPWEMAFDATSGVVVRRKGGNLAGFSALFSFVPELNVSGNFLFNGATDEFKASQFYQTLLPALFAALKPLQKYPPMPSDTEMDYFVGEYMTGQARVVISKSSAPLPNGKSQSILILDFGGTKVLLRDSGLPNSNSSSSKTLAVYIPEELVGCMKFELSALDSQYVTFGTASSEPNEKQDHAGYLYIQGYVPGIVYHRKQ